MTKFQPGNQLEFSRPDLFNPVHGKVPWGMSGSPVFVAHPIDGHTVMKGPATFDLELYRPLSDQWPGIKPKFSTVFDGLCYVEAPTGVQPIVTIHRTLSVVPDSQGYHLRWDNKNAPDGSFTPNQNTRITIRTYLGSHDVWVNDVLVPELRKDSGADRPDDFTLHNVHWIRVRPWLWEQWRQHIIRDGNWDRGSVGYDDISTSQSLVAFCGAGQIIDTHENSVSIRVHAHPGEIQHGLTSLNYEVNCGTNTWNGVLNSSNDYTDILTVITQGNVAQIKLNNQIVNVIEPTILPTDKIKFGFGSCHRADRDWYSVLSWLQDEEVDGIVIQDDVTYVHEENSALDGSISEDVMRAIYAPRIFKQPAWQKFSDNKFIRVTPGDHTGKVPINGTSKDSRPGGAWYNEVIPPKNGKAEADFKYGDHDYYARGETPADIYAAHKRPWYQGFSKGFLYTATTPNEDDREAYRSWVVGDVLFLHTDKTLLDFNGAYFDAIQVEWMNSEIEAYNPKTVIVFSDGSWSDQIYNHDTIGAKPTWRAWRDSWLTQQTDAGRKVFIISGDSHIGTVLHDLQPYVTEFHCCPLASDKKNISFSGPSHFKNRVFDSYFGIVEVDTILGTITFEARDCWSNDTLCGPTTLPLYQPAPALPEATVDIIYDDSVYSGVDISTVPGASNMIYKPGDFTCSN